MQNCTEKQEASSKHESNEATGGKLKVRKNGGGIRKNGGGIRKNGGGAGYEWMVSERVTYWNKVINC